MSFFKPARKVDAPDGRNWEIYVSRGRRDSVPHRGDAAVDRLPRLRPRRLRVEAVSFHPWLESHLWLTTKDHAARVVDQIAAGLEAGQVAMPLGAEFRGSQERVANSFRGLNRDD